MTFTAPPTVLAVRIADGAVREVRRPALAWDPDDFVSEQVFVVSDDGTRVPMFLIRRRDVVPDGDIPTLLYGYGGFQISNDNVKQLRTRRCCRRFSMAWLGYKVEFPLNGRPT